VASDDRKSAPAGAPQSDSAAPRRHFLKVILACSAVLVVGGIASVAKSLISPPEAIPSPSGGGSITTTQTVSGGPTTSGPAFPRIKAANLTDLSGGKPLSFNYPLQETPNLLVKLGVKSQGGVGPDSDIVAFSQLCQHLGCVYGFVPAGTYPDCDNTYKAPKPVGYCCCHGSVFDLANKGVVIDGPSPRPVPQVTLEFDSSTGDIYAIGMSSPAIFGHDTGSNDVSNDLKGGTPVS
jgi:arsenite oxidase small subunit